MSTNYRMTVVRLTDGRVLNGLVTREDTKTLQLQTSTASMSLLVTSVAERRRTSLSPMPDGLLDNLDDEQVRDLIGYLMQPSQTPLISP